MAEVKLTVKTNFADAEKDLQKLGEAVKGTTKTMTESQQALQSKNIDVYLEKQKRLADAVAVTRGESASNAMMQRNLRNEYERLYKTGVDPTSAGMVKLKAELDGVTASLDKNAKSAQQNEKTTAALATAIKAYVAAVAAASAAVIANAFDMAKQGDVFAKQASILGVTAEQYQALTFAADRSGVSQDLLTTSMQKLSVGIGQAQAGTGALQSGLSALNPELLEQLKNADGNAEAFTIMMDAMAKTGSASERAALATAAFGKSGQKIANMSIEGANGLSGLIAEAERYGLMSDESAKASEAFVDAQTNLKQSFFGVRSELAEKMIPELTVGMQKVADFVSNGDKMRLLFTAVTPILAGLTAGLITFGIVTKGQAIVTAALTTAQMALNAAMAVNPAVWIAAALVGLVAAIVLVRKNWDTVTWAWSLGVNSMKIVLAELMLMITDKFIPVVVKIYETLGKIPLVGKAYQGIADGIQFVTDKVRAGSVALIENSEESIRNADAKYEAAKKSAAAEQLKADAAKKAGETVASVGGTVVGGGKVASAVAVTKAPVEKTVELGTATELTALEDKLMLFENTEAVAKKRMLDQYSSFYDARIEQDAIAAENQVAFVQSQSDIILGMGILSAEQEVALKEATAEKIKSIEDANANAQYESMKLRLANIGGFFGNLQTIAKNAGKESRALAVVLKGIAIAEAGLLGVKSIMQSAASAPFPANIPAVLQSTAFAGAQLSTAMAIKIPSAETGANFVVPDSTRTDSTMLRVNRGEEVNVTPRGEDSKRMQQTSVFLDGRVILRAVQEFVDSGELRISADNIVGAY